MTVVYLDAFLLLNITVNYILLCSAGRLDGEAMHRLRYLLAAAIGAAYAAISLMPSWAFLQHPICKAGAAVLMLLAAFGDSPRILRTSGLFLVLSCAFGGLLLIVAMVRGTGRSSLTGVFPPTLGMRGILIAAALSYGCLSILLKGQFTHTRTSGELQELTLSHNGRTVTLLALCDTGNTLSDPMTGLPVVVVEGEKLWEILPELQWENLKNPVEIVRKWGGGGLRLQLLPYRAVGVDCGLLLAVRLDSVEYGKRKLRNCLTALSPTPLSDGGGYCALIGGQEG